MTMTLIGVKYIVHNGRRFLLDTDVANVLKKFSATEETDTRDRILKLALEFCLPKDTK